MRHDILTSQQGKNKLPSDKNIIAKTSHDLLEGEKSMSIIFAIAAAALTTGMLTVIANTPISTTEPENQMVTAAAEKKEEEEA